MQSLGERPSVLLVEDQPLICLELCETLTEAGLHVIGPANTAAGAQFLLKRCVPSAAIVDVRVRDGASAEVVQRLKERNIPFLVHSRHPQHAAARDLQKAPWLPKPASPADLLALLGRVRNLELAA